MSYSIVDLKRDAEALGGNLSAAAKKAYADAIALGEQLYAEAQASHASAMSATQQLVQVGISEILQGGGDWQKVQEAISKLPLDLQAQAKAQFKTATDASMKISQAASEAHNQVIEQQRAATAAAQAVSERIQREAVEAANSERVTARAAVVTDATKKIDEALAEFRTTGDLQAFLNVTNSIDGSSAAPSEVTAHIDSAINSALAERDKILAGTAATAETAKQSAEDSGRIGKITDAVAAYKQTGDLKVFTNAVGAAGFDGSPAVKSAVAAAGAEVDKLVGGNGTLASALNNYTQTGNGSEISGVVNKLKTSTPVAAIKPPDLTKIDVPTAAELLDKAAPVIGASKDAVNAVVSTTKDAAGEAKNTLAATGTAVADTLKAGGPNLKEQLKTLDPEDAIVGIAKEIAAGDGTPVEKAARLRQRLVEIGVKDLKDLPATVQQAIDVSIFAPARIASGVIVPVANAGVAAGEGINNTVVDAAHTGVAAAGELNTAANDITEGVVPALAHILDNGGKIADKAVGVADKVIDTAGGVADALGTNPVRQTAQALSVFDTKPSSSATATQPPPPPVAETPAPAVVVPYVAPAAPVPTVWETLGTAADMTGTKQPAATAPPAYVAPPAAAAQTSATGGTPAGGAAATGGTSPPAAKPFDEEALKAAQAANMQGSGGSAAPVAIGLNKSRDLTLGQLADTKGMPNAPITPQSAMSMGGNPDQAKMAGTPGQTAKALQTAPAAAGQYATAAREEQARSTATAAENAHIEAAKAYAPFGTMGSGVLSVVNSLMSSAAPMAASLNAKAVDAAAEAPGSKYTSGAKGVNDAYAAWAATAAPNSTATPAQRNKARADLSRAMGIDPLNSEEANTALAQLSVGEDKLALAKTFALNTPDMITVADVVKAQPSFEDALKGISAEALGLPPGTDLHMLPITQLQALVTAATGREFGEVGKLQAILNDKNVSTADRAEARRALAALGAVGVRASEAEVRDLETAITNADDITLRDGTTRSLTDLLKDTTVSAAVTAFLNGDKDALANYGDLAGFVTRSQDTFRAVLAQGETDQAAFQKLNEDWAKYIAPATGNGFQDKTLKALGLDGVIYDASEITRRQNIPTVALLTEMQNDKSNNKIGDASAYIANMETLANANVDIQELLGGLSRDQLLALGLAKSNDPKWLQTSSWLIAQAAVKDHPEQVVRQFFGDDAATGLATIRFNHDIAMAGGEPSATEPLYKLLAGSDGELDASEITSESLAEVFSRLTLSQINSFKLKSNLSAISPTSDPLGLYGTPQAADGLTMAEILDAVGSHMNNTDVVNKYYGNNPTIAAALETRAAADMQTLWDTTIAAQPYAGQVSWLNAAEADPRFSKAKIAQLRANAKAAEEARIAAAATASNSNYVDFTGGPGPRNIG